MFTKITIITIFNTTFRFTYTFFITETTFTEYNIIFTISITVISFNITTFFYTAAFIFILAAPKLWASDEPVSPFSASFKPSPALSEFESSDDESVP